MIETSKKDDVALDWVSFIYYSIWFEKNEFQALINFGSKVNVMTPVYALKLDPRICYINVKI